MAIGEWGMDHGGWIMGAGSTPFLHSFCATRRRSSRGRLEASPTLYPSPNGNLRFAAAPHLGREELIDWYRLGASLVPLH